MNDNVGDVDGLVLHVRSSGDVGEPDNFFDSKKYGHDRFSRMAIHLIDDVLTLREFTRNQMPVVFLQVREDVIHGIVDGICCAIANICRIRLLECGNIIFNKGLLDSRPFEKETHFFGVCYSHV